MTVLVGVIDKKNKRVVMGSDSQMSAGWSKLTIKHPSNLKIWKPKENKDVLIAHTGLVRDANILQCVDSYIDELTELKGEVSYKYIVTKVVPKIRKELISAHNLNLENLKEPWGMESSLLFAYKDKLWKITSNFTVIESDDYLTAGSGFLHSAGYMQQSEDEEIYKRIEKAISSACDLSSGVGRPIVIMNTKDDEIKIIE